MELHQYYVSIQLRNRCLLKRNTLQMRELFHDNVNRFLGASFEESPCCLFLYCPKGSLKVNIEYGVIRMNMTMLDKFTLYIQNLLFNSFLIIHYLSFDKNCALFESTSLKASNILPFILKRYVI